MNQGLGGVGRKWRVRAGFMTLIACGLVTAFAPGQSVAGHLVKAPALSAIKGSFHPSKPGKPCNLGHNCLTVYSEATPTALHNPHYKWTVDIPKDPECAKGFHAENTDSVIWDHADTSEGGLCNHKFYNATGSGHPGLVTLVVTAGRWTCKATIYGTQGPQAQLDWAGPPPPSCKSK